MILQQFPVVADPFFRRLFESIGRQPEMGFADTLQSGIGELLLKPRFFRFVSAKKHDVIATLSSYDLFQSGVASGKESFLAVVKAQMQKRLLVYGFFHSQPRFAVARLLRELQPFDVYLVVACRPDKDVFYIFIRLGRLVAD